MKPNQLITDLPYILDTTPVVLKGSPGIGKTDIFKTVAANMNRELMISHPVMADPTDNKGMPCVVDMEDGTKVALWIPYGDLDKMMKATEPLIVFYDDLGQATPTVQAAIMQIILERSINGQKISDQVRFIAATNKRTDRAGVKGIITPLLSRSNVLTLDVDVEDWIEWAFENGQPPEMIAFVQFRPELLHQFDPRHVDASGDDLVNQPCPRTVAACGNLFNVEKQKRDDTGEGWSAPFEVYSGAVGEAFASEFLAFVSRIEKIGDLPRKIVAGKSPDCPEDPSTIFALSACLSRLVEKNGFDTIGKWVGDKMPEEFAARFLHDSERQHGTKVTESSGYADLAIKIDGFLSK